ncbi:MAG: class I SAM-dependent methyltransferase [Epsilonproteobacteria bacterium]|nr:class I SAM-dependent methyltransferase [Campylobacterota bacterium]
MSEFDQLAPSWDANPRRRALAQALATTIKSYWKGGRVLDFGCGTGLLSYNLLPEATQIIGVDASPKMRALFDAKSPDLKRFYATAHWPEGPFDLVCTSMTLHHIRDLSPLLERFVAALAPGGMVALADLFIEDGTFHDRGNAGVYHFGFDPWRLARELEGLGMELVALERPFTIRKHRDFPIFCLIMEARGS